jgi:polysaccharide biosynthesis transport protein
MLDLATPTQTFDAAENAQGYDLREMLGFVWRHWMFIGAVVGASLLIGTVSLLRQTPLYTATSQVLLDRQSVKAPRPGTISADADFDDMLAMIQSQIAIIRSTVFLRRVVEKENLVSDPEFGSGVQPDSSLLATVRPAGEARSMSAAVLESTEALKGALSVVSGPGYLLLISVTSVDPLRAARLSNAIADFYLVDKLDTRFETAQRASTWLSDRIVELRKQLSASENAVTEFRNKHPLYQSSGNIKLDEQQLSDLNAKLVTARADAAQKKARIDMLEVAEARGGDLQRLPDVGNGGALPALRQQAAALSQQEADLLARYGAPHPLVVNIRAQRRDVERAIAAETKRLADNIRNDYKLAQAQVTSLEQSLQDVTGQTNINDPTAKQLRELEKTVEVNKTMFDDFLQRAKITQQDSTFEPREARVISPALPPGAPSYPSAKNYFMMSLFIGLFFGIGGAVAKEMLNAGFTTPQQVEEILGLPLLGTVSRMRPGDLTVDGKKIPIERYPAIKPLSRYSESIRALRSGIQMTDVDNPPKVVQVTSAAPGEGKTTIALSLAALTAHSGYKVLVIDADLRHPSASRLLGLHDQPGLVDLLLGRVKQSDVIRALDKERYWILPAGTKIQNPPDFLGSDRMKTIVANCKQTFDLVVIDTPPAGPVVDPVVVAQFCDTVVLVVRWAATARELVKHCAQKISGRKRIAGVIFNVVDDREARKYGHQAYYYGGRYYKNYYSD